MQQQQQTRKSPRRQQDTPSNGVASPAPGSSCRSTARRRNVSEDVTSTRLFMENEGQGQKRQSGMTFHIGPDESGPTYRVEVTSWNDKDCEKILDRWKVLAVPTEGSQALIGLDCEWTPPWFRNGEPERICTIQLYSPIADGLILSTANSKQLPRSLLDLLADNNVIKVGVNIVGDASRISRDFGCPVRGLINIALGSSNGKKSLEDICGRYCPKEFHVDKAVTSGIRLGDWSSWPLSDNQVRYASLDAVLSFAAFFYQKKEHRGLTDWGFRDKFRISTSDYTIESTDAYAQVDEEAIVNSGENTVAANNSDFFMMMRNKSVAPPMAGKKTYPHGSKDCLSHVTVLLSGVLESMTRDEMTKYVLQHGGKVAKSVTKSLTHLVNDVEGTVGHSKLAKCKQSGVLVVGEEKIFDMVRESLRSSI